jgi:hypothetical protein
VGRLACGGWRRQQLLGRMGSATRFAPCAWCLAERARAARPCPAAAEGMLYVYGSAGAGWTTRGRRRRRETVLRSYSDPGGSCDVRRGGARASCLLRCACVWHFPRAATGAAHTRRALALPPLLLPSRGCGRRLEWRSGTAVWTGGAPQLDSTARTGTGGDGRELPLPLQLARVKGLGRWL